jgi:hypothetical protein
VVWCEPDDLDGKYMYVMGWFSGLDLGNLIVERSSGADDGSLGV